MAAQKQCDFPVATEWNRPDGYAPKKEATAKVKFPYGKHWKTIRTRHISVYEKATATTDPERVLVFTVESSVVDGVEIGERMYILPARMIVSFLATKTESIANEFKEFISKYSDISTYEKAIKNWTAKRDANAQKPVEPSPTKPEEEAPTGGEQQQQQKTTKTVDEQVQSTKVPKQNQTTRPSTPKTIDAQPVVIEKHYLFEDMIKVVDPEEIDALGCEGVGRILLDMASVPKVNVVYGKWETVKDKLNEQYEEQRRSNGHGKKRIGNFCSVPKSTQVRT